MYIETAAAQNKFDHRLAEIQPKLKRLVRRYCPVADMREDFFQVAQLAAWRIKQKEPNCGIGLQIHVAKQAMVHYKRYTFRQVGTIPDSNVNYIRKVMFESELPEVVESNGEDDPDSTDYYDVKVHQEPMHDTAEILDADRRIDLELLLKTGFEKLEPEYHADMKLLMADLAEGYSNKEIARRQGWTEVKTYKLLEIMRRVFGNGEYHRPTGVKKPVPESVKLRVVALVNAGYSIRAAARSTGLGRETARKIVHQAQAG